MHKQHVARVGVIVASFLLVPLAAWAQSSITGVVRDASGGVLPGVTVEAASPALIEKVRSVVTDERACTGSSTCGPAPTPSRSRCPASARAPRWHRAARRIHGDGERRPGGRRSSKRRLP